MRDSSCRYSARVICFGTESAGVDGAASSAAQPGKEMRSRGRANSASRILRRIGLYCATCRGSSGALRSFSLQSIHHVLEIKGLFAHTLVVIEQREGNRHYRSNSRTKQKAKQLLH